MACCLPTCAQGLSAPVLWTLEFGLAFLGFVVSSWCFLHMESFGFAALPVVYRTWVL